MQIRCALVGMPGSGKSTVGRQLAHRAGVPFIDLDHWLEKTIGTTIRSFFETEGEARFRDLEAQALAEITQQPGGMVLSTGGGAMVICFRRCAQRSKPIARAWRCFRTRKIGSRPMRHSFKIASQ